MINAFRKYFPAHIGFPIIRILNIGDSKSASAKNKLYHIKIIIIQAYKIFFALSESYLSCVAYIINKKNCEPIQKVFSAARFMVMKIVRKPHCYRITIIPV